MQMSKVVLSTIVSVFVLGSVSAAHPSNSKARAQRVHIKANSIDQVEGALVVQTTAGPVVLKTLRCDKRGVFFTKKDLLSIEEKGCHRRRRNNEDDYHGGSYVRRCPHPGCGMVFYDEWDYWQHVERAHGD
jgi:uncharacterized C2H2 Zn-finger protein